ncbi:retrotransposon with Ribonuclease H-like superfamily and integrase domain [Micractinium conductrix]|uniref:Retrotransposon with Ribonuclease H-like superfamily and integrase domain n=1 Tax=Micractinium conductrix TaxID=554055 RepID=A0A2P6UYW3_9CHLO|nr:retrotransposon with Ribonuclease H-like superfamily and integrase domain [Micractinium conductrix]|eukprot:PSC67031.1 retrotransposon with Ribonuclease H-like superfamily and integrase domain [Micractinium conductrix]
MALLATSSAVKAASMASRSRASCASVVGGGWEGKCAAAAVSSASPASAPLPPLDAFIFNGGAISWASRLQPTVAASTTEAEYISAATTIKEGLWLRKLFQDLSLDLHTVAICADSQTALKLLKNPIVSNRSKHIDVVHHFARERVARNEVTFEYISTESMVADALTKPVPATKFNFCPPPAAPRPRASLLRAPRGTPPTPRHQQYSAIAFTAMAQPSTEPELSFSADGRTIYVSTEPPPPEFVTPFAAAIPFSFAAPPEPAAFSAQAPPTPGDTCRFVLDTGASRHMTPLKSALTNLRPPPDNLTVTFGNGAQAEPTAVGDIHLELAPGRIATITDVLYLPTAAESLFSVSYAAQKGYTFSFGADGCTIYRHSTTVATAPATANNIYYLEGRLAPTSGAPTTAYAARTAETPHLWHRRLGHLGFDNLAKLPDMVTGIRVTAAEFKTAGANALCEPCTLGKQHRLPFNTSTSATKAPLELLHTDLCGPLPAGLPVKRVRSDNGGEFCNSTLSEFYTSQGVLHETTNPYSPQQNGKAERLNRTLWEKARPMLSDAGLPKHLWADAIVTANYLRNRSPLSGRDKTPFELFYGTKPDVSHLRIFGATVFAHTPSALRTKLDPVSQPGRLIGYAANRKGYKILLNSGAIITSRDVTFDESKPPKPTSPTSHKPPSQPETSQPEPVPFAFDSDTEDVGAAADAQPPPEDAPPPSPPLAQCRQVRVAARRPASEWQDDAYRITGRSNVAANAAIANEPTTMKEALSGPDAAAWQLAMDDEMASLIANDTWTSASRPTAPSPSQPNLDLHQLDIKTAFLNGTIDEEVYAPQACKSSATQTTLATSTPAAPPLDAFIFNGGAISWASRLQPTVAASTTEAEYISAATTIKEGLWLRKLFQDLSLDLHTVAICADSQTALKLLKNPIVSNRSKHIDVVHHFARERVARNEVTFEYISTESMVADALTKPVPATKFNFCRAGMGLS